MAENFINKKFNSQFQIIFPGDYCLEFLTKVLFSTRKT